MMDKWLQPLQLAMSADEFQSFVPHPAFRSEYISGELRLSPRPRNYHCLLPIGEAVPRQQVLVRNGNLVQMHQMSPTDGNALIELFVAAFSRTVPICQLSAEGRRQCATECLTRTLEGRDGPLVRDACFVALDGDQQLCGAILITLLQRGDLGRFDDPRWLETAPENALTQRWGRPHLTWIFVRQEMSRWGIGGALLSCSLAALHGYGYEELASTFLLGNDSSTLWHWRMGFQVLPYTASARRMYED